MRRIADATERAGQKIILQRQLADLRMQRLDIGTVLALLGRSREDFRGAVQQLGLPLRDLVRMHIEPLRQLGQGLVAPDGGNGHLGLERR